MTATRFLGFAGLAWGHSAGPLLCLLFGAGCAAPTGGTGDPVGRSGVSYQVTAPCGIVAKEETEFTPITKAEFAELFADYVQGFRAPIYHALSAVNDEGIWRAFAEVILGTVDEGCRSTTNYDVIQPSEGLIDPQQEADDRADLVGFLNNAVEVSSGEVLRLSFHECENCSEPIGEKPTFWNIRRTKAGALLVEVELAEGESWTKKFTIREKEVAFQGEIQPASDWMSRATEEARSGATVYPALAGTFTAGLSRDDEGRLHAFYGVSRFELVSKAGTPDELRLTSNNDCAGFEISLGPQGEASTLQADLGDVDLSLPGTSFCPESGTDCGDKERNGPFDFHYASVEATLTQPPSSSPEVFTYAMSTAGESTASVGGDVFAQGGLGDHGKGGGTLAAVTETSEGFLVTFTPALDMGAALTISSFSEQLRMNLPNWLSDQVFDLTFGGDPVPSVLVPFREMCPEGMHTEVPRRELEIMSGRVEIDTGDGVLAADAGQCVGESLGDPATFDQTSDFWELGFACTK